MRKQTDKVLEVEAKFIEKQDAEKRKRRHQIDIALGRHSLFADEYDHEHVKALRAARLARSAKRDAQKQATLESVRKALFDN